MNKMLLIVGGPSEERGISLNSARSVLDHIRGFDLSAIYVDGGLDFYEIGLENFYSNTPFDFDFKKIEIGFRIHRNYLVDRFAREDLIFPLIHGKFGEDGLLQEMLEGFPYVGSGPKACYNAFHKDLAIAKFRSLSLYNLPYTTFVFQKNKPLIAHKFLYKFFSDHGTTVIKPVDGGSSIGIFLLDYRSIMEKKYLDFLKDGQVYLLEPELSGTEFTVSCLEENGQMLFLPPVEIEKQGFFDFRKKYLPTTGIKHHVPPRFCDNVLTKIKDSVKRIQQTFNLKDYFRVDGWLLDSGELIFTDLNPVPGLEQNSFLFKSAYHLGFDHSKTLEIITNSALSRNNKPLIFHTEPVIPRKNINIIMGGDTSERQVSLLSGVNVWLKLKKSERFSGTPFVVFKGRVYKPQEEHMFFHTVEEVVENTKDSLTINEFLANYKDPVFIALHGGEGEDGTWQRRFEANNILYTGVKPEIAEIFSDKFVSYNFLEAKRIKYLDSIPLISLKLGEIPKINPSIMLKYGYIIKPAKDGCSSGVVHLSSLVDLEIYWNFYRKKKERIPAGTFYQQNSPIEISYTEDFVLMEFIPSDIITFNEETKSFAIKKKEGFVEMTIGFLDNGKEQIIFNPSITLATNKILSVEDKFQGGTGVNLTPPPSVIISAEVVEKIKNIFKEINTICGIKGYGRWDFFYNRIYKTVVILELNCLPGLTPSTVFFHQSLAEKDPISPVQVFEIIIDQMLNHAD